MNEFENKVNNYISQNCLLDKKAGKVIVAVSGGADSVALLAVLTCLGYDCVAAHCNFHLRGDESERDMRHVEGICQKINVPLEIIHFDVKAQMEKSGESLEMACRTLRYAWFEELKKKYDAQSLATGHHSEDNVETMLLNMLRGTGIAGAAGIAASGDRRVSPLISCTKQEILDYLEFRGLDYVTDSSNLESDVKRNMIRNEIMPVIRKYFPDADERLAHTAKCLREDYGLIEGAVNKSVLELEQNGKINISRMLSETGEPEVFLYHVVRHFGFNRTQSDNIFQAKGVSGRYFYSKEYVALVNRGELLLRPLGGSDSRVISRGAVCGEPSLLCDEIEMMVVENVKIEEGCKAIYLDVAAFDEEAVWELRRWRKGDRMKPFGMRGRSKKLSDIFNDAKLSAFDKDEVRVLTRNEEIIWVIGLRASDLFRVTDATEKIVRLAVKD